jgi:succinate dehydrogenase flavin-adding protein (antitoxin of CptAB toxin-antitoxin module)
MTPKIMRQLWSVVETAQAKTLLQLDDASLVQWLVKQTNTQALLEPKETDYLCDYIQSRLSLIRDLAYERQC